MWVDAGGVEAIAHQAELDCHKLGDSLGVRVLEDRDGHDLLGKREAVVLIHLPLVEAARRRLAVEEVEDVLHGLLVQLVLEGESFRDLSVVLALRRAMGLSERGAGTGRHSGEHAPS